MFQPSNFNLRTCNLIPQKANEGRDRSIVWGPDQDGSRSARSEQYHTFALSKLRY